MKTNAFRLVLASSLLLACATASSQTSSSNCQPLETRAANAPSQRPAFAGQTRACAAPRSAAVKVTVLATGLVKPWAVEPLPDGTLLVALLEW